MTIKEKVRISENPENFILFKEGVFYKIYNRNAMLFTANIKAYMVKAKYIKNIGQDVYSIGFPISSFDAKSDNHNTSIKQLLQNIGGEIKVHSDKVEFTNIEWENKPEYEKWCSQQKEKQLENEANANKATNDFENLKQRILGFQIVNKTPMQAFEFIMELQGELKN